MSLLFLATCLALLAPQSPGDSKPAEAQKPTVVRVQQPAPPMESVTWISGVDSATKVVVAADWICGRDPTPSEVAAFHAARLEPLVQDLHHLVVIVQELAPDDAEFAAKALPVLRDLGRANEDRWLRVVYVTSADARDASGRLLEQAGIAAPLGVCAGGACYVDPADGPRTTFVIGRSGELAWKGDVVRELKPFLAALKAALERSAVPSIARALAPTLEPALAEYYVGRFEEASARARKIVDGKKPGMADARDLLATIDAHKHDLLGALDAQVKHPNIEALVELDHILRDGFPPPLANGARERLEYIESRALVPGHIKSARALAELDRRRPLFFPARRDDEGLRFARELEQLTKARADTNPSVQRAQRLLERFAQTK